MTRSRGGVALTSLTPVPETIDKLVNSIYSPLAMLAGMELDLFTPLKDGSMNAEQLAEALGVRSDKLSPLLYALVAAGLLTVEGDLFSNTSEADHFLVTGRQSYIGGRRDGIRRRCERILDTAETIRTGVPRSRTDYANTPPERMESLVRLREKENEAEARDLMSRHDFSSYHTLLDVGGGGGFLSLTITEAHPHLQATVVDLPTVTPITGRIVSEAGAEHRVDIMAADIVNESIKGSFDVAVLTRISQIG